MGIVLETQPAEEPIGIEDARVWCKVESDDTEGLAVLTRLIVAARQRVEKALRRSLVTQTWRADFRGFPCPGTALRLPKGPVQEVTAFAYSDDAGADTPLDDAVFTVDLTGQIATVWLAADQQWPTVQVGPAAVRVTYTAGYGAADDVPEAIKQEMRGLIAQWFDDRSADGGASVQELRARLSAFVVRSLA